MDTDILVSVKHESPLSLPSPSPLLEFSSGFCYIAEVPFRGCNCTDAAGREFAYKDVMKMLGKRRKYSELFSKNFALF